MIPINSLRFRVALAFAIFGALLSILLSAGLFLTAQELGHRLMDETLIAELDDVVLRHERESVFIPPNTFSIKGYVLIPRTPAEYIPDEIKNLLPGNYNITLQNVDYRMLVKDSKGARYFMLFNTDRQHRREAQFLHYLIYFALLMTLCSAGIGYWLAMRVVSSVTRLAQLVGQAEPEETNLPVAELERNDEVGDLARAFDRYLRRMQEFIQRENYFMADVSHELRTPLAIIWGAVEILEQDSSLSAKQLERLERIKRAGKDMSELTTGLLMLAREYHTTAIAQSCDVGEVVQSCVDKHAHLLGDSPVKFSLALADSPKLSVARPLLEIVIGNLIRNAIFNTRCGEITLRLEAERFVLSDTGSGMPPEILARVFERHFKGMTSAGAGVGLSLVKRICDRYGWQILIASEVGKGTQVEVTFATSQMQ